MAEKLTGLSAKEAEERIKKYGYNELDEKTQSWVLRLFRRFWGLSRG
jgi:H+-transporting ATPase